MILQRLSKYYERLQNEGADVPVFGFQRKELPFIVVLERDGSFMQLQDTRTQAGKRLVGQTFLVPSEKGRSGKNSYKTANLLWDHPGYLFGLSSKDAEMAKKQYHSFVELIEKVFGNEPEDEGVSAVLRFLKKGDFTALHEDEHWEEILKRMPFMSFRLRGDDRLVPQRTIVVETVERLNSKDESERHTCMVTGNSDVLARLHPKIKGVFGAQSSGAALISFNLSAFNSYGKTQGENAPVGEKAAFAYTTALNRLLRSDDHRLRMGDVTVLFWSKRPHPIEDLMKDFFGTHKSGYREDTDAIRGLLTAPKSGVEPREDLDLPFYVLGLSPNAARLSVRFWYEGSVGKTLDNVRRYFEELRIVKRFEDEPEFPALGRLLLSTALEYKWENVPPNLSGTFFMAAISGARYPETLLSAIIRRIRAEASNTTVTYERAALLKALLIRNYHKEITMSLDPKRKEPAYLLGRLFAVLEHLQSRAQGNLNASIRERYYGSASSTPIAVFPTLLKLSTHHLAKLDSAGLENWYESQIGYILRGLDEWPTHLPLKEQALFALGYYHQRADLYTAKKDKNSEGENDE